MRALINGKQEDDELNFCRPLCILRREIRPSCENLCKKRKHSEPRKMLPEFLGWQPTILSSRPSVESRHYLGRKVGTREAGGSAFARAFAMHCRLRSVLPSLLSSPLLFSSSASSASAAAAAAKANFIGCYKFRPSQSPNRRRRRRDAAGK